ncbi:flagellar biosynthesis protein FlhA [Woeseia oceani]|uniref:Flagellar biosynthesis protein FlhA n=1 Tax=Woeseia oceani TaxID=1548547 RepID=A0A193LFA1_9GAMM|nr:flagellar biosynthesis protein FlhA [Woeseia oceani]ANO51059.1 flagellar biosynthesis protein FlhA [Woeseia oceani]
MANSKGLASDIVRGLGVPLMLLTMLAMVMIPLPPMALDILFTFNIALAVAILLTAIYVGRPLDFGVFPTILLVVTLLRLVLNVASTRVVLLDGHTGTGAAGKVIEAFGEFVVGGNYAVGLVIFGILVIINFVVVTKGAGRVSEVTARFTLDAMPGKQMAIDADLNAGVIDQDAARLRRQEIGEEADFYGSMDGASKFVRGDAVAGILILFINIIGGLIIGTAQHDLSLSAAMHNYTLLTIGDGLVAQIPSLLLSTAVAIIVTRMSKSQDMGTQMFTQLFADHRTLIVTATVLTVLGLIPGMPNFAFLSLAAACGWGAWRMAKQRQQATRPQAEPAEQGGRLASLPDLSWQDVSSVDMVGLDVGYRLIPLVDRARDGALVSRIKGVRKKLTEDLGFLIPPVHIRDNLDLGPSFYRISLMGVPIGEAEVHIDRDLAINPGQVFGKVNGIATRDPAFGLEAYWIDAGQREEAQMLGYTVVDTATVVATHLSQLLQNHAHELLGHEETQQLLDRLAASTPKLVEELTPKTLPMSVIARVLQNLLEEGISVKNIRRIAETLAENGAKSQDPDVLSAAVRVSLGRSIVQNVAGTRAELPVLTLEPELERILNESTRDGSSMGLEPGLVERLHESLNEQAQKQEVSGDPAVLLVPPNLRPWLARMMRGIRNLHVLAYNEIPDDKRIQMVGAVS